MIRYGSAEGSLSCDTCQADFFFRTETKQCELCDGEYEGYDCAEAGTTTLTATLKQAYWKVG